MPLFIVNSSSTESIYSQDLDRYFWRDLCVNRAGDTCRGGQYFDLNVRGSRFVSKSKNYFCHTFLQNCDKLKASGKQVNICRQFQCWEYYNTVHIFFFLLDKQSVELFSDSTQMLVEESLEKILSFCFDTVYLYMLLYMYMYIAIKYALTKLIFCAKRLIFFAICCSLKIYMYLFFKGIEHYFCFHSVRFRVSF